jgi:hypothetical protein
VLRPRNDCYCALRVQGLKCFVFSGSGTNWCYPSRVSGNILGNTYGSYVDVRGTSYVCTPCMNWIHRGIVHTHRWYLQRTRIRTLRVAEVVCVSAANCLSVSAPMQGARKWKEFLMTHSAVVSWIQFHWCVNFRRSGRRLIVFG